MADSQSEAPLPPVHNMNTAFDSITDFWSPKVVCLANGQALKVAKIKGEFVWHAHEGEDEVFHVIKGACVIQYKAGDVHLSEGDVHVVPAGVQHCPRAAEECWISLLEPVTTKHTGDTASTLTRSFQDQLQ